MQDCSNSSTLALELLQSCDKPSMWFIDFQCCLSGISAINLSFRAQEITLTDMGKRTNFKPNISKTPYRVNQIHILGMYHITMINLWFRAQEKTLTDMGKSTNFKPNINKTPYRVNQIHILGMYHITMIKFFLHSAHTTSIKITYNIKMIRSFLILPTWHVSKL